MSRIYFVETKAAPTTKRLIRAENASQALRFVADEIIASQLASQDTLIALLAAGTKVEDASEETPAQGNGAEPERLVPRHETA